MHCMAEWRRQKDILQCSQRVKELSFVCKKGGQVFVEGRGLLGHSCSGREHRWGEGGMLTLMYTFLIDMLLP